MLSLHISWIMRKAGKMIKGIDISYHNGGVDLKAAKSSGIDFVIIRMGYGDNVFSQNI